MTDGVTDSQQTDPGQPDLKQSDVAQSDVEQAEGVPVQPVEEATGGANPTNPAYESTKETLNEAVENEAEENRGQGAVTGNDGVDDAEGVDAEGAGAEGAGAEGAENAGKVEDEDAAAGDGDEDDDDDDEEGDPLDVEGEVAADYLEELLDIADLDGDIDTYVDGGRAHVSVVSESNTLVGAKGEVLDALQELARLAVMTETGNRSRLMLDVAGYREGRRKELQELATEAVEEAKSSADSVRLSPMNPFERKIVHDAVAAAGLSSESEGEEPKRRVVVIPSA